MSMNLSIYPSARKDNIVVQHVDDEILAYDLEKNKAYCLNQTSALIWNECDGTRSVDEISRSVSKKLKTPVSEDIVNLALSQLKIDGLLANGPEFTTPFDGLSRRDAVKRIGFASLVALPVIASLVAPDPVGAATAICDCTQPAGMLSRPPGCACTSNSDCCNGVCGASICGVSSGVVVGPGCCPMTVCGPANAVNPPGCSCNTNANCVDNMCVSSICAL